MRFLQQAWSLDVGPIAGFADWDTLAKQDNLPNYNAYLRENLNRLAQGRGATISPIVDWGQGLPTIASITHTLAPGTVTFVAHVTVYADVWATLCYLMNNPLEGGTSQNLATTIDYQAALISPEPSLPVKNLPHGSVWYLGYKSITLGGNISPFTGTITPIVIP